MHCSLFIIFQFSDHFSSLQAPPLKAAGQLFRSSAAVTPDNTWTACLNSNTTSNTSATSTTTTLISPMISTTISTLESAIKTYQLNFNLETTGTLDDQTLKQLARPRCGVSDVINGSTSMNAGKRKNQPPSPPHPNIHTVARYSFFNGARRWTDLTYAFLPGNNLTDSAWKQPHRWSAVIPMTFNQTTSYSGADIKIGIFRGDHGDGEPFDGKGGVLGHAFAPPDGRFHLDEDEEWAIDGRNLNATSFDMETVVMDEIGHVLGLAHSSVAAAVMYPTVPTGRKKVELDIDGIQALYGSNPNYKRVEPVPTYWLVCE